MRAKHFGHGDWLLCAPGRSRPFFLGNPEITIAIGDEGAKALAEALTANVTLKALRLSSAFVCFEVILF